MRSLIIVLAALAFASAANATPQCTVGVPCGNTCIAKGQVCTVKKTTGPTCKGGKTKPCGATCIPVKKTCHT